MKTIYKKYSDTNLMLVRTLNFFNSTFPPCIKCLKYRYININKITYFVHFIVLYIQNTAVQ